MCAAPALLRAAQLNWILPTPEPRRPDGWSPRVVALAQSLVQGADRRPALLIGRLLNAVRSGGISQAKALLRGQEFRGSDEHEGEWLRQRAGKRDHREVLSGDYIVIRVRLPIRVRLS